MDQLDDMSAAERQPTMVEAVCWECGRKLVCHEFVVCCTGTLFHLCPECEAKGRDEGAGTDCPSDSE